MSASRRERPPWDFDYAPVTPAAGLSEPARDLVVATLTTVDPGALAAAAGPGAHAAALLDRAPLFWTRLSLSEPALPSAVAARISAAGLGLRYVASAELPSLALRPALDLRGAAVARPAGWAARPASPVEPVSDAPGAGSSGKARAASGSIAPASSGRPARGPGWR